jgi:ubiquinone/menaquinone biosynthesis C-methylase UbiE
VTVDCSNHCDFDDYYTCSSLPAMKLLEREVLGCDYGGTSWTTRDQADFLVSSLNLDSNTRLLEVGSGAGWPGLYLSTESGCNVTMLDMPLIALKQAKERAEHDNIIEQVEFVNASGASLPFSDASFDRLSHCDVLCCLPEKQQMLEECRRIAATGARMTFFVIEPAPDLSDADHERAIEAGPPFVDLNGTYSELLEQSGWQQLERIDITETFAETLQKEAAGIKKHAVALEEALGTEEFGEMLESSDTGVATVTERILQRFIYVVSA